MSGAGRLNGNAKFIRKPIAVNIRRGESVAQPSGGLTAVEGPFGDRGGGSLRATNILGRRWFAGGTAHAVASFRRLIKF
jgi:hypothetical protein